MWINTVCFVAGVLFCQQLTILPEIYWLIFSIPVFYLAVRRFDKNLLFSGFGFVVFGFSWAVIAGHTALDDRISPQLVKKEVVITGVIVNLPRQVADSWRFEFAPSKAIYANREVAVPEKLRLSWYHTDAILYSGQTWQLTVSLKPPVGQLNPGGFDYETWLYQQGFGAVGYVKNNRANKLIASAEPVSGIDVIREKISYALRSYQQYPEAVALLQAISIGEKSLISQDMWAVFRHLGINHLVAISGLHIGILAMAAFMITGIAWRCSARLCLKVPAPHAQSLAAILGAAGYSALAGFSIPTQRAMIMLIVIMAGKLLLKNLSSGKQLSVAAFFILLYDPIAVISPGFWLSFVAVVAIYIALSGDSRQLAGFKKLLRVQWFITIFLMPLSLYLFNQASLVAPLVNILLIPVFSFFVVPAALLISLLNLIDAAAIDFITRNFLIALSWSYQLLEAFSQYPWISYANVRFDFSDLFLLYLPALAWSFSSRFHHKAVSIIVLLGVLLWKETALDEPYFRLAVLDVGQGLSVFVQQHDKALLYDLGPRYGKSGSATESIVVPFLKYRGIGKLDYLIISHFDSDHSGNPDALLKAIPVRRVLSGEKHPRHKTIPCRADSQWQWGQVVFEILSPLQAHQGGNNSSCVLKITLPETSILLTGDIESKVEKQLLTIRPKDVQSDIVIIPHHGSKSSSTLAFTEAVRPKLAINSSGYLNRYDFPDQQVKNRWQDAGSRFLDTAIEGAIEITFDQQGRLQDVVSTRAENWRYWNWQRLSR